MKKVYLMYPQEKGKIAPEVYGHFTEHLGGVVYGGIWVGKDSSIPNVKGFRKEIVDKLKAIHAPVIRWPGGCFAESYDWRDGIGKNRPVRINWWTAEDGKYESNEVGTHEYMDFCEAVGADAYFAANMTCATPMDLRYWMDYCLSPRGTTTLAKEREANGHPEPFNIPHWGVGNENWGSGGNMLPDYYANEYRRYGVVMTNTAPSANLIACGPVDHDYNWTRVFFGNLDKQERTHLNGYSIHYYCNQAGGTGEADNFTNADWDEVMRRANAMEEIVVRNWATIVSHGLQDSCKLVVDEWGCWHPDGSGPSKGEKLYEQQSTMRDAMVTALTLNIFNNHCDKVMMANAAQLVNNLHCLFLADGEHCITTPTYHVFDMYKEHQGAQAIGVTVTDNAVLEESVSISVSVKDGKTLVTIGNLSCEKDAQLLLECVGFALPEAAKGTLLSHEDIHAHNTFEDPENVTPVEVDLDLTQSITVPKASILAIRF